LSDDFGNVIDTFKGIVTKDLIIDPDRTVSLTFTQDELDGVYRKALQIRLFELREPSPQTLVPGFFYGALSESGLGLHAHVFLMVKAGAAEKHFEWWHGSESSPGSEDEWKGLGELLGLINGVVENRAEYKALPEPMIPID
jgi:hypothetical protein